jgi:hypothetical protein
MVQRGTPVCLRLRLKVSIERMPKQRRSPSPGLPEPGQTEPWTLRVLMVLVCLAIAAISAGVERAEPLAPSRMPFAIGMVALLLAVVSLFRPSAVMLLWCVGLATWGVYGAIVAYEPDPPWSALAGLSLFWLVVRT